MSTPEMHGELRIMQSGSTLAPDGLPRADKVAFSQQKYLALGHDDGSLSILNGFKRMASILNPWQSISMLRLVRESLFVGFESKMLVKYHTKTGLVKASAQLDIIPKGVLLLEEAMLVWGDEAVVLVLHRKTLAVEREIKVDSIPLYACKEEGIALVLSSGTVQWLDSNWEIGASFKLPLKSTVDGEVNSVVGAYMLPNKHWVIVQRRTWTLFVRKEFTLIYDFDASAPDPFNSVVPDGDGVALTCDNETVVFIENNNVQIVTPSWKPNSLAGIASIDNAKWAILRSLDVFEFDPNNASWKPAPRIFPLVKDNWVVCDNYAAKGKKLGCAPQDWKFESDEPISAMMREGDTMYVGLENGALVTVNLKTWKLMQTIPFFASPVVGLGFSQGYVSAWSCDTAGVLPLDKTPVTIPVGCLVKSVTTNNGTVTIEHQLGEQSWSIEQLCRLPESESRPAVLPFSRTWLPVYEAPVNLKSEVTAIITSLGPAESVSILPSKPTASSAPVLYTLWVKQGGDLEAAVDELKKTTSIGNYEDFTIYAYSIDHRLGELAANILTKIWPAGRVKELESSAGTRSLVVLNAVYPLVPVGNWLKEQFDQLLDGTRKEQLLAVNLLALHPLSVCPYPFAALEALGDCDAARKYVTSAATTDMAKFHQALRDASDHGRDQLAIVLSIKYVTEASISTPEDPYFIEFVSMVVKALRTSASKPARDLLAQLRAEFPRDIVFNRRRQRLLVTVVTQNLLAVVFDFVKGTETSLVCPVNAHGPEFVDDGGAVEASADNEVFKWTFPTTIASFFKGKANYIDPVVTTV